MTVKELKQVILKLPEDTEVFIELNLPDDNPVDGSITTNITTEVFNDKLWLEANFYYGKD